MYEIKNNINGKIYVGVHKTKVEDDGYMGSGKVIKSAIAKHGIENFTKTILERFDTQVEMFEREKEVVNEEFLARDDTYNLRRGGYGGFDHVNKTKTNQEKFLMAQYAGQKMKEKIESDIEFAINFSLKQKKSSKNKIEYGWTSPFVSNPEYGLKGSMNAKSFESTIKRKKTFEAIGHSQGENNSQFGSMWITNGTENMKIKKDSPIPEGWKRGRISSLISMAE